MHVFGFDPGGQGAFGWAVLSLHGGVPSLRGSGTCSSAPEALAALQPRCDVQPAAFASDAPLFWAHAGDRVVDQVVRKMVCASGGAGGTVGHVNSLRGACLVQGVLVSRMASERWPDAQISEAHPTALLCVSSDARDFAQHVKNQVGTEHERDAAIAAYTAHALMSRLKGWRNLRDGEDSTTTFCPLRKPVSYWLPAAQS